METTEKKEKLEEIAVSAKNMILGLASSDGITDVTMIIAIADPDCGSILTSGNQVTLLKLAAWLVNGVANDLQKNTSEAE